jgi:2-desacetyl-2-hydroxyethyl bacteriochlorophyllide A dehydrogenase
MQTIILEKPGLLRLTETRPPGPPGPAEALVRVRRVGICGTDLHAFAGRQNFFSYPQIMGHELAVEVVAIGPTDQQPAFAVGDQCCVIPYLHCGECIACRRGKTNCCVRLQVLGVHTDGGMRELITVPVDKLLKAEGVPLAHLALVEMLCIGAHAVSRVGLEAGENVVVIGAGPIGLSTLQFVRLAGARPILLEINPTRLSYARQVLGLPDTIDGGQEPLAQLQELLGGELPTAVFDATGNAGSMMGAFDYVAHGGQLIFIGHFPGEVTFRDPDFHARELTLRATRNATRSDFLTVIEALTWGRIELEPWITHRAGPEQLVGDFPGWLDPQNGVVKAMLEFT